MIVSMGYRKNGFGAFGGKIPMTEKTVKLFRDNNVILRGVFDSAAERLAREYRLRFLHLDVELASAGDYYKQGRDIITLRFRDDGRVNIHQDCKTQGISAGNIGGGKVNFDLPMNFYLKMTPQEIADKCWGSCREGIISNGRLASFMKKARKKNGYYLDFTRQERPE